MHDLAEPNLRERYQLDLPANVDSRNVGPAHGPDGLIYEYMDLGFHLDQERIISLVMGVNLYAERVLFLRELVQNAVDACRHRAAIHRSRPELGPYIPKVCVRLFQVDDQEFIEVEDNGMGMDDDIVRNYFAKVGRSYYSSGRFLQDRATLEIEFKPISQFGIGVLSAFMAGDLLQIETRRLAENSRPLFLEVAGQGSLFWFRQGTRSSPGTRVILRLSVSSDSLLIGDGSERGGISSDGAKGNLFTTIAYIAPHMEFPITVEQEGLTRQIIGGWRLPEGHVRSTIGIQSIDLDLTCDGPDGLAGIVRIFLLKHGGKFVEKVMLEDHEYQDYEGEDLRDYLTQRFGYIEHVYVDRAVKDGITHGYSDELTSQGRWSQQGFHVPYPLFHSRSALKSAGFLQGPSVDFPFTVWYDLNLSGDFTLPLSADRKSVLPLAQATEICQRISRILANAFFQKIGIAGVQRNGKFFVRMSGMGTERGRIFLGVLENFLRHHPSSGSEAVT